MVRFGAAVETSGSEGSGGVGSARAACPGHSDLTGHPRDCHSDPPASRHHASAGPAGPSRRGFLGYILASSTLVVAADLGLGERAFAASAAALPGAGVPGLPQVAEAYDLEDAQTDAARPTAQLITITVNADGTASFALHRTEVGQGITTSTAMIIAEELGLPVEKVLVTLAPARPELAFNQLTGGSNSTVSTYTPIRVAAAIAKGALLEAAALELGSAVALLTSKDGVITAPDGSSRTYGELAAKAASDTDKAVRVELKPRTDFAVIGKPHNRVDAEDIVTGRKRFSMDLLDVAPGAIPTMVCRAPTLNGSPRAIRNKAEVLAMPGVSHVALLPTGVAVGARTFGQCIDGVRALSVDWAPGSVEGESDETVLAGLRKAEVPLAVPKLPLLAKTVEADFTFMFKSSAALEPYAAVADVRKGSAEVWAGLKVPIVAQVDVAKALGLPEDKVKINVITGGGSFGHKLFNDHAIEAARASQAFGVPVRLMWHRADEPRQGRMHPMATSRIRASYLAGNVLTFEQRHTSISTDFSHGFGEMVSSLGSQLPAGLGNLGYAELIFTLTQELGYEFGAVDQLLDEADRRFNTGSMRNIYSPDVRTASELVVDRLAKAMGKDPLAFRLEFLKDARAKSVLSQVASAGRWGRAMPAGYGAGDRDPQGVQGRQRLPRRDRLPPRDRQPAGARRRDRAPRDQGGARHRRGAGDQPPRPRGADDGRLLRRDGDHPDQQRAPARGPLPRGQLGQLLLHAAVERAARLRGHRRRLRRRPARRCRGGRGRRLRGGGRLCLRAGHRHDAHAVPGQPRRAARLRRQELRPTCPGLAHRRPEPHLLRRSTCPTTPSCSTGSRSASTSRTTSACSG